MLDGAAPEAELLRKNRRRNPSAPQSGRVEPLEPRWLFSTYYVSTAGLDQNPGTLSQPFHSIQRAANLARAGDVVLVRGGVYHETVTPTNSGTASARITYKPYGSETVTIDGADPVRGWTLSSGSVYRASQAWDLGDGKNQLFVDGKMLNEARWPNTSLDVSHPALASAGSISASLASAGPSTATLNDPKLTQPAGYWVGASIHIAPGQAWVAQTGTVTSSSPGSLTYSYTQMDRTYEVPKGGNRYFLAGKFQALDAPAEWYRDAASKTVHLWTSGGDSPAAHSVEAKARQYALDLRGKSYLDIQGFRIFAATIVTDAGSSNLRLTRLDAQYLSHFTLQPVGWDTPDDSGIYLAGTRNELRDSTIAYSAGHGVMLDGSSHTIANCTIRDVDYNAANGAAINIQGSGHLITSNTLYNSGRNIVRASRLSACRITHNLIHDGGLQTTDVGGIYAYNTDAGNTEIAYNRIYNLRTGGFGGVGLFLDNNSSHYLLHHNVVWNTNTALKMNDPSRFNQVYNNTLAGGGTSLAIYNNRDMTGSVFKNNIFTGTAIFGAGATRSNNIYTGTDPRFANAAANDYTLLAGSPAIDTGTVVAPYTDGYAGTAPDIGAYESGRAPFYVGATAPPIAVTRNARLTIQAESYDAQNGVLNAGPIIGNTGTGDWLKYARVDFGAGVTSFRARIALANDFAGKRIEVRTGSPTGALAGTLITTGTGGWATYLTESATVSGLRGVLDLYLVFQGGEGVANVDSFVFA